MSDLTPVPRPQLRLGTTPPFEDLIDATLRTVTESSKRVYNQTYLAWWEWCDTHGVSPYQFGQIEAFLLSQRVSLASRRRMLSAMRTLVGMLAAIDYSEPRWAAMLEVLKRLRVPKRGAARRARQRVALTPEEVERALAVWRDDLSPKGQQAYALIAVAVCTGLRRAELLALRWQDVDLERGIVHVREGAKGDRQREAAIYGTEAIRALRALGMGRPEERVFPMSESTCWRRFRETGQRAGLAHFSPHDGRRTMATELLEVGEAVHNVQKQMGHASASTTLQSYAFAADAVRRRRRKLRFGE